MRVYLAVCVILFLTMLFVPLFSLLGGENTGYAENVTAATQAYTEKESTAAKTAVNDEIRVMRTSSGKVETVDMRTYVICCVASEMLPEFEKEALKAQAVVSYTYALYLSGEPYSGKADITDSPSVHQAYRSREEIKEKWGDKYKEYIALIEKAVDETEGKYITYNGEIIKPAYHAMSSGRTCSAADAWGGDVPYLQSVSSDGDRLSPKFLTDCIFSQEEMKKILSSASGQTVSEIEIGEITKNDGGYVLKAEISGISFTGEKIRQAFSLRSSAFTLKKNGDTFTFTCTGCGHGVGMSQNGAQYMAKNGSTYEEIIAHYYPGTEIKS